MGKREDQIIAAGTAVATTVSLWDRAVGWFRGRKEKRTLEEGLRQFEAMRRNEHEITLISDELNRRRGRPCPTPKCQRPWLHAVCRCGESSCPGNHGPRLKPWGAP